MCLIERKCIWAASSEQDEKCFSVRPWPSTRSNNRLLKSPEPNESLSMQSSSLYEFLHLYILKFSKKNTSYFLMYAVAFFSYLTRLKFVKSNSTKLSGYTSTNTTWVLSVLWFYLKRLPYIEEEYFIKSHSNFYLINYFFETFWKQNKIMKSQVQDKS